MNLRDKIKMILSEEEHFTPEFSVPPWLKRRFRMLEMIVFRETQYAERQDTYPFCKSLFKKKEDYFNYVVGWAVQHFDDIELPKQKKLDILNQFMSENYKKELYDLYEKKCKDFIR